MGRFRLTPAERDRLARIPLVVIWVNQLVRVVQGGNVTGLAMAASTGIGLLFLLGRRPALTVDRRGTAWLAAIAGTLAPMLLQPDGLAVAPPWFTTAITTAGVLVTTAGILSLGRSFGVVASNRGIVSSGIYRWVRHPLYAGYFISHVGFCLANPSGANIAIWVAGELLQLIRIRHEERLLSGDVAYQVYRTRVRWRLLPGVF